MPRGAIRALWQQHRGACVLGGLMLSLAAALGVEAMPLAAQDDLPEAAHRLSLPRTAPASATASPSGAWQETALARPLFALNRRPPLVAGAPDPSMPRLSGTIRFSDTALAIFEGPATDAGGQSTPKSLVLGVGAGIAGWTIAEVSDEEVVLAKDGQMRALRLSFSKAPPAAVPQQRLISSLKILHGKKTNVFWQP